MKKLFFIFLLFFLLLLIITSQKYFPKEPGIKQFGKIGLIGGETLFFAGEKCGKSVFARILWMN